MGNKTIYCPKCNHSRKVTVDDENTVSNIQVNIGEEKIKMFGKEELKIIKKKIEEMTQLIKNGLN